MDMQKILQNVIASTNEIFQAEAGSVALLEPGGHELIIRAAVGAGADAVRGLRIPVSKGVIGWVATQEQPALISDVASDSRFFGDIDKDSGFSTKSIMCVPMRANGIVIGVIELMNMNAHYLSADGLKILGVIADHAALAIENARLLNRTRQQTEDQAMVFGAMAILTSDLGLETVLDAVSRQMVAALNADLCIIYRWEPHQNLLLPAQYYSEAGIQPQARLNLDVEADSPLLAALSGREPQVIYAQDKDLPPHHRQRMKRLNIERSLLMPLVYRRHPIGLVEISHHNLLTPLTPDELILGETMAAQAAVAIENASLFNEASRRLSEARLLQEVMAAAASTLDFEQVLNRTIAAMHQTLGIEQLEFFLPDRSPAAAAQAHSAPMKAGLRPVPPDKSVANWVAQNGQPVLVSQLHDLPDGLEPAGNTQSEICVPVMLDKRVVAVLHAQSARPNAFDDEDLQLFVAIAAELAVALKNARLFETEHRLVNQQQALLDIYSVLSAELQPEKLFRRIIERAVDVIPNAEAGSLIVQKTAGRFGFVAAVGFDLKQLQRVTFSRENFIELNSISAQTSLPKLRVIRLNQAELETANRARAGDLLADVINFGRLHEIKSSLRAMLVAGNYFLGALNIDSFSNSNAFSAEDEKILLLFANQAAIALQNARLFEEIKSAEANYRDLFDNANDLIFTLDSNFRVSSANKATLEITGYSLAELIGMPSVSFISPTQNRPLFDVLKQHLRRANTSTSLELSLKNKAGRTKLVEVTLRVKRRGLKATELHCIARDITRRRELEQQLQQTEKLSSIGKLVAGVAHELNNPLTSIVGYTNLLEESNLHPQQKRDLQVILRQAERARVIVRDLLTFARNIHLERELVDVNEVIHASIMLFKEQLQQNNVHLVNSLDFGLPRLIADPHQLEHVFVNLMTNSVQALANKPRKKIITIKSSYSYGTIQIALADNGPGIAGDIINQIFDPFFSTRQVGEGTGLGLSICYGIISAHGGKIWAENNPEGGSIFVIELPVSTLPAELSAEPEQLPLQPEAKSQAVRIMVIDDETYLLELMDRVLSNPSQSVHTTDNGRKALAKLLTEPFDVIICDILMPDLTGIELYQQVVAAQPQLANRFIFVTGNAVDTDTRTFLASNNLHWVAKPFMPADITAAIAQILNAAPAGPPPGR